MMTMKRRRQKSQAETQADASKLEQVIIDRFEAPDTVITLIPRRAGKPPKVFTVHHLVMDSLGISQTIPYIATLTNPVPKGEIETSGTFGPWNVAHPARTPVTGKYVFANANLDTIDGLAGVLSSTGEFPGLSIASRFRARQRRRSSRWMRGAAGSADNTLHRSRRWLRRRHVSTRVDA